MKTVFRFLRNCLIIYVLSAVAFFGYTFIDSDNGNNGEFYFFKPARFLYNVFGGVPEKTNFVIFGTDEGGTRTDTVIAGCFNKTERVLNLVSIPRDTIVTVSDREFDMMNEGYPEPGGKTMKLNSVYHFSKQEYGIDIAVSKVEDIIGSHIDYYCIVDFDALNFIVDEIGGVDFYVPCDMYYIDPEQDLYIELYEGQQTLFGDKAEQLLRFRSGYANADLGRVEVQQEFLKEFISQAMEKENIVKNFRKYVKVFNKYVETDMPVSRAVRYAGVLGDIPDIKSCTAPGYTDYVDGVSGYTVYDEDGILSQIFK